jgi:hypothetical protein
MINHLGLRMIWRLIIMDIIGSIVGCGLISSMMVLGRIRATWGQIMVGGRRPLMHGWMMLPDSYRIFLRNKMRWEMLTTHNMMFVLASRKAINELCGILIVRHLLILRLIGLNACVNNWGLAHKESLNVGNIALRVHWCWIVIKEGSQLGTLHKRGMVVLGVGIRMGRSWRRGDSGLIRVVIWGIVSRRGWGWAS